ncbi:homeobox-DDT domain protein RLT3 isoform X2 [Malania oleifera]|uniref:homeobox-DDT domain protein RLT3 isoform X2 n=1 Tax=Malania oleifera TaxID=397392 RepID=UPI0025ADC69C|nr:homeobox-DDT domain protein RLT3 isoform X2 [Malania oleifera]
MVKRRAPPPAAAGKNGGRRSRRPCNHNSVIGDGKRKQKKLVLLQESQLTADYILKKVFRKDGPPLGVEFDSLPSGVFCHCKDSRNTCSASQEIQRVHQRRKVVKPAVLDCQVSCKKSAAVRNHGIGKGLMTVWQVLNPGARGFPTGVDFSDNKTTGGSQISTSKSRKPLNGDKKLQKPKLLTRRLRNKVGDKKKTSVRRRKAECNKDESHKTIHKDKCQLALVGARSEEHLDSFMELVDDEELEVRELQAGPNPLTCSAHFATNGLHCCSLCKDLLSKFPPDSVKMRQPFCLQPWDSSPGLVKKLFKVFHFLYTYAATIDVYPFTLDEFAESFHDKDSLLLGKVHVALLKFLLSNIEMQLSNGCIPRASKNFFFLGLLHSVERQEFVVKIWNKFLNPLTWTEILRQVLIAAGFGSKEGTLRKEFLNKEVDLMVKYGLRPGTLKCELFSILSEQGNSGLKVSELARSLQIVDMNLASTTDELECLISSTLASDITLFEKISASAYRLRTNSGTMATENSQSDTDDSGSIDDDESEDGDTSSSGDEFECDSLAAKKGRHKHTNHCKSNNNMLTVYSEIDESHPGEVWLLGLMEGEYSDLSTEEKLDALIALVDLLSAATSITVEDPMKAIADYIPNGHHFNSGAKIKRSSAAERNILQPSFSHIGKISATEGTSLEIRPIDSSSSMPQFSGKEKTFNMREEEKNLEIEVDLHPMQSVFLGSDRRYNRYWIFLGPCNGTDPGHKRVYFESSEDGHWEVIDTLEALCALLSALDNRGRREALLLDSLEKRETYLCQAMSSRMSVDAGIRQSAQSDQSEIDMIREESSSPVSDVDNNLCMIEITKNCLVSSGAVFNEVWKKGEEQKQKWNRLQAFDAWIWNSFYCNLNVVKYSKRSYFDSLTRCESCHDLFWRDEKHCRTCHSTFELDFNLEERYAVHAATCREKENANVFPKHKVLPSQLQALKAAIHAMESVMPKDALVGAWRKSAHKLWVKRLRRTSSLAELLQVLADFVGAINEDWLCQSSIALGSDTILEEIIACFPTMPQTSSAVALWLVKVDSLIAPHLEIVQSEKAQRHPSGLKGKRARE